MKPNRFASSILPRRDQFTFPVRLETQFGEEKSVDERNGAELVQVEINVEFVLFLLQSHFYGCVYFVV